jgi:hypothetical protein
MNPTLIIGLGGFGSRAATNIYKKFLAGHPSSEEKDKFACLCLDTDHYEIDELRKQIPHEWVLDLASRSPRPARPSRSHSYQLFLKAESEGMLQIFEDIIKHRTDDSDHWLGIHIICSLAGHTGSGIFLQTACYLRDLLNSLDIYPYIIGYFVLADVFCLDRSLRLNQAMIENMRANTYASLKELNTFNTHNLPGQQIIEFKYHLEQSDTGLPSFSPYDSWCYLMDYNPRCGSCQNHLEALSEFVFVNLVSNHFRSHLIPLDPIANASNRYAKFGLSKLVYPVDDLYAYFARQSIVDHYKSVWCRIDKDIQERFAEYKKNCRQGIPDSPPDMGMEFMRNVENYYIYGVGEIGFMFSQIYKSTQVLDEDGHTDRSKAVDYVNEVRHYVESVVNNNFPLQESYRLCTAPMPDEFVSEDNTAEDIPLVHEREQDLENFRNTAMGFIGMVKIPIICDCFLADHDQEGYVSAHFEANKHRLNNYILEKDNEMHPLAVRYFLYDVRLTIDGAIDGLKKENKDLLERVDSYQFAYDDPQTPSKVENAIDSLEEASDNMNFLQRLLGGRPYKEAKEAYVSKSKQQAENIHRYVISKTLEEVYEGLSHHINLLVEEIESFFNLLPKATEQIEKDCEALLEYHDNYPEGNVTFVLASKKTKKIIYDSVIRDYSPIVISPKIAASVYRGLYHNTVLKIWGRQGLTAKKYAFGKGTRDRGINEIIESFVKKCIAIQDEDIRENNPKYAKKNVMDALREEAMVECEENRDTIEEYMIEKLGRVENLAGIEDSQRDSIHGGYFDGQWFGHSCEREYLYDRISAHYPYLMGYSEDNCFNRNEIIMVTTVSLLKLDEFLRLGNDYKLSDKGAYFRAYDAVRDDKVRNPHLDRHWSSIMNDI